MTEEEGMLDQTKEVISGSQDFNGSTPTAKSNCEFLGWYIDKECTTPVTEEYGTVDENTGKFIPDKNLLSDSDKNVFYAKFSRKASDITISRSGVQDPTQVFVYEIKNNETNEIIYATITGNSNVTIQNMPFGEYTITQKNSWSWRYSDSSQETVIHNDRNGTAVFFNKKIDTEQWLNGNSNVLVNRKGG